jgi:hypothetical protein
VEWRHGGKGGFENLQVSASQKRFTASGHLSHVSALQQQHRAGCSGSKLTLHCCVSCPCCSNESLKAIKEAAKQQEWASDKAIMEEYAAQMEKQEAARRAQVGRAAGLAKNRLPAV